MFFLVKYVVNVIFEVGLFINALLFIPQIIALWQKKHADDVSLITFAGFNIINLFMILHGLIINDTWLVIGISFSTITNTIVTALIIWYRYIKNAGATKI
jgi:MtN3 and saliva related transmembrane protein